MDHVPMLAGYIGPIYLLVGLSLLLHPKSWQHLLEKYQRDHYELFPLMLLYVILGLAVIDSYDLWEWNRWIIVTLTGWALLIKGVFYFLAPGSWITPILNVKHSKGLMYLGGVVCLVLGAVLSYPVFYTPFMNYLSK